ncbi:MAG TPA: hypothetical protein PKA63_11345 [Oligoflexia bacterium]|nr:hypothetical protein [Oligoflexia bacterium]HMP49253.1 hypothetical protein [Oligoflexia bacterium]
MTDYFRVLLLPVLLALSFALNILLPINSADYYFSILAGEKLYSHGFGAFIRGDLLENTFSNLGSLPWFSSSALFDLSIFYLESRFGYIGPASFQLLLWSGFALLAVVTFYVLSFDSSIKEKDSISRIPFITFISILFLGGALYGSDIKPCHLVLFALLVFLTIFWLAFISGRFYLRAVALILLIPLSLFDYRITFVPVLSLIFLYKSGAKTKIRQEECRKNCQLLLIFQALLLTLSLLVPPLREGILSGTRNFICFMDLLEIFHPYLFRPGEQLLRSGISFNSGFIMLLIALYVIRNYRMRLSCLVGILLIGLSFLASAIFPFYRFLFALYLSVFLILSHCREIDNSAGSFRKIHRIEEMFCILSFNLARLSFSGRVFFLVAFVFVQFSNYIKVPVTDFMMPVREVTLAIERNECLSGTELRVSGYLAYRYAYGGSSCRPDILFQTLSSLTNDEVLKVKQMNYFFK